MAIWVKTNGNKMEINNRPETIEYAESLGWTREGDGLTLDEMTKEQLNNYTKERFKVELILSKTKPELLKQVKALEDDDGN